MVFIQTRKVKGIDYLYLAKSVRFHNNHIKLSRYLGKKSELSKKEINEELNKFVLEADSRVISSLVKYAAENYIISYPLTIEEIKKIEEMNFKYHSIKSALNKKDWIDVKKRFIANFVFESNALEGNSLTLKNFSEIVFENKVIGNANIREINDAKNSYAVFSGLFNAKKEITEEFIISLHKRIMKDIDDRTGYKTIPNILLGRNIKLTPPEKVSSEMKKLIVWYNKNKQPLHPLELAFKFHHKFENIHPFADGNGRVGRMLLNYILIKKGYYPVIIRKIQRNSYLKVLQAADLGQYIPMMRFAVEKAKETYRSFFEIYYKYV